MDKYPATPKPKAFEPRIHEISRYNTIRFRAENGSEQRDSKWANPQRSYKLFYEMQDAATIWNLHDTYKGAGVEFYFDPYDFDPITYPTPENIISAFDSDEAVREVRYRGRYYMEVNITESK